jgi:hypothetical protein
MPLKSPAPLSLAKQKHLNFIDVFRELSRPKMCISQTLLLFKARTTQHLPRDFYDAFGLRHRTSAQLKLLSLSCALAQTVNRLVAGNSHPC